MKPPAKQPENASVGPPDRNPYAIERELRARLTVTEYRVLQARLTGAAKAIDLLRERAPDLVPLMFGDDVGRARLLSPQLQGSLAFLIDRLLLAAATTKSGTLDRRRLLKLVSRLNR